MPDSTPRQRLRALRDRAGRTAQECSDALGYASPSGYQRYEMAKKYDRDKYPYGRFLDKLMPLFVGRGTPPITADEVLAIADIGHLAAATGAITNPGDLLQAGEQSNNPLPTPGAEKITNRVPFLYRMEVGITYNLRQLDVAGPAMGPLSPLSFSRLFPNEAQFCVSVGANRCRNVGQLGATFLVVKLGAAQDVIQMPGLQCLAAVPTDEFGEYTLNVVITDSEHEYVTEKGERLRKDTHVLGLIIAKYEPLIPPFM